MVPATADLSEDIPKFPMQSELHEAIAKAVGLRRIRRPQPGRTQGTKAGKLVKSTNGGRRPIVGGPRGAAPP